jgi:uncharacterized protein YecE (DUF72 family)
MIRAGTSGFSYKEWKGAFYPEDLPATKMLEYYASRLPTVEINNTFYRMPKSEVLDGWADKTGSDFRFVLKASRRITHFKRLAGVEEELEYFLRTAATLGPRLGAVLFQLPPNMKKDVDRLRVFLDLIAAPSQTAFEFRHASWFDDEVVGLLRERGAALCTADTDEETGEIVRTGPMGYLRLRRADYSDDELDAWSRLVSAAGWEEAFVFFKHEDEAGGPRMAESFLQKLV